MKNKLHQIFKNKYEVVFVLLFFVISVTLCFWPYFWKGTYEGLDSGYHLARIESLADMLRSGIFPVKLHSSLCYGYGYGTGFFYPNFFLYFPAILVALGADLGIAAKLLFLASMIGTFLSGYYCTWKLTRNVYGAVITGAMILMSPLMINSVYYVFALGHVTAMPFIALSIVGLYLIIENDDKPWMFIIGFWGLLLTHSITMLMTLIVCVMISLLYCIKILKNKNILKKLIISVIITTGLTTAYWLPLLEQYSVQKYKISQPWTVASENVPGIDVFMAVQNGPGIIVGISLLICILYTIWRVLKKQISKIDIILTGIAFLLSIVATSQFFWNTFESVFDFIQYPFRLFYLVTVLVFIELGIILSRIKISRWLMVALTAAILIVNAGYIKVSLGYIFNGTREYFDDRKITDEVAGIGSGQEWLPVDCSGSNFNESAKAFADDSSGADGTKEKNYTQYNVYVLLDKVYYDMPYTYYYGYKAELTEEDGTVTQLKVGRSVDKDGKLRVYLPEGKNGIGVINVKYEMTSIQKISYVITGCFVALLLFILIKKSKIINTLITKRHIDHK